MLLYQESSGSLVLNIPFGSSATLWFWSPANQPGASQWPVGAYDTQIWVLGANANIDVSLTSIRRTSGLGTTLEVYATGSLGSINCSTTGPKRFQGTTIAQSGQPTSGDRVLLGFTFTHNGAFGSTQVTVEFGNPAHSYLQVPILMPIPQIVWNGNTLAFPKELQAYNWRLRSDRVLDVSTGRVSATGHRSSYDEVRIVFGPFEESTFADDLRAWWAWARRGKQYSFALDPADVVNLALNGAAAAGQKDIPLAVTASVVVGRNYLVRAPNGEGEEIIQVASVTTNVKAVAQNNLRFSYATGDTFRSVDYYPKMVSQDSDLPLTRQVTTFLFDHTMAEDRG